VVQLGSAELHAYAGRGFVAGWRLTIQFADGPEAIKVSAKSLRLTVQKEMNHDPSCGARQWFHPLASVSQADMGLAAEHSFTGSSLGTKWSDPNRRSAFFGTFSY